MFATSERPYLINLLSKKKTSGNCKLFKLYLKQHIKTHATWLETNLKACIRAKERLKNQWDKHPSQENTKTLQIKIKQKMEDNEEKKVIN